RRGASDRGRPRRRRRARGARADVRPRGRCVLGAGVGAELPTLADGARERRAHRRRALIAGPRIWVYRRRERARVGNVSGNIGGCVLVVDDDADVRGMLAQVLELEGYDVVTAADGREALRRLEERRPFLVLLDLMMPGMNGWQFRAEQLKQPGIADVPVVVLSGDGSMEPNRLALPG